ncbi:TIGR01621 family pseudouridine synthase [Aestuariirhabdus litorea]|uniref:TIGR01621 family pseudouridine synthase n=1 Tax=Aestuariirhabdus litorea TaxID=2528527 RepID=A0A3P3VR45_9GAMM|nr:TIGR01621 family pseudouridine synthase [Aestuariirhabdus litorea]RRJ85195.1 TIGR01621 family pseudouridine synthase [Aestuariirhabdus litorea]RWW98416.1 TIGR01621 family pseudouridine synthase [Endozoicomonadaceae bacterium GTF-13]
MSHSYQIHYAHPDFLVIDKSPGVSVHRDDGPEGLVAQIVREQGEEKLFLVHRLDRLTTGLLLLARHAEAAAGLADLFRARRIDKFYLALSARKPSRKQGLVSGDMSRARRGSWKLEKSRHKPAITQFFSHSVGEGRRLFLLKPATGRTHQIRVAMKSLGAPILGDARYSDSSEAEGWDRGYLHAYALRFEWRGERLSFRLPPRQGRAFLEEAVARQIEHWADPWGLPWPVLARPRSTLAREANPSDSVEQDY